jgi:SNF2 family DNA or RNA helicase
MKKVILLNGFKLRKKPRNLYNMMQMIKPNLINTSFYEFSYRYCDPRQKFEVIDYDYSLNLKELKKINDKRIMVIYRSE